LNEGAAVVAMGEHELQLTGLIAASGADPRDLVPLVDQVLDVCFKIGLRLDQRIGSRGEIADRTPRPRGSLRHVLKQRGIQ
jgi:hypothetical protein